MLDAMLKCRNCATYLAGMTRHINNGIECLSGKRREAVRCVAVHGYEACAVRNFSGDAPRGARYVMAQRAGMGRNCAPEKLRAAEDQQTHLYTQRKSLIEQNIRSNTAGGWARLSAPDDDARGWMPEGWSPHTTLKIASARTACARKPTVKATVRNTGRPSV